MAWNDPGKNENPWKRRPEQGPPDLDEVLRQFQKKLRSIFGGGGPRTAGNGTSGGGSAIGISYIVAGLLIIWALTGFYQNDAAERSVITRFGRYIGTTTAGLNWRLPWPIDRRTVVNVTEFKSFTSTPRMLTQDEALVDIKLAVGGHEKRLRALENWRYWLLGTSVAAGIGAAKVTQAMFGL